MMKREKLSKCIKIAMMKKGVSQGEMAKLIGVGLSSIANYRAGRVMNILKLTALAEACDMTFDELMKLAD
jgi:transcriptional regulator with XRE-family HTH domain